MSQRELDRMIAAEEVERLRQHGLGHVVDAIMLHDVCFRSGNLNHTALCRALGCNYKQLAELLGRVKDVLGDN